MDDRYGWKLKNWDESEHPRVPKGEPGAGRFAEKPKAGFWLTFRGERFWMDAEKYSSDQPRVPAGSPEGGQWTSGSMTDTIIDEEAVPIEIGYNVSNDEILKSLGPRWQSFDGDVYRGPNKYRTGRDPNKPKSFNVYGDGTYYAMTEEGARTWTDEPKRQHVYLDNPLRLDSRAKDEAFRSFVQRDTGIEIKYPWNTRLGERAMTKWLEEQSYDGIVVNYPGAPGGAQVIKIGR